MWHWDSRTHQFIAQKALAKCRQSFVNLLQVEADFFILGIESPDRIFKDFTNHYYNCTANSYGYHYGSVIKKIESKIAELKWLQANPTNIIIPDNYPPFLHALLDNPLKVFCFELGALSHYIADLHQPFHTDGKERFSDEETIHQVLEADVRKNLNQLKINLHRRYRIKDFQQYFTNEIYHINSFYDTLVENYYRAPGKVQAERWIHSQQIIEYCLAEACQNIANVFLSFEDATIPFAKAKRFAELQKKIQQNLQPNSSYRLRTYPSGTISIRQHQS
ncbi:MAG: zinc dependent phospholipase C family protein [Candidatus Cloacimonadales bacterium]